MAIVARPVTESQMTNDVIRRIASVPKTPLDAAAETLKACAPHDETHSWAWFRQTAMDMVRDNREDRTAVERLVCRRYREALDVFRRGDEVA